MPVLQVPKANQPTHAKVSAQMPNYQLPKTQSPNAQSHIQQTNPNTQKLTNPSQSSQTFLKPGNPNPNPLPCPGLSQLGATTNPNPPDTIHHTGDNVHYSPKGQPSTFYRPPWLNIAYLCLNQPIASTVADLHLKKAPAKAKANHHRSPSE